MTTGAHPIPLYRSAVDGIVPPTGYDRRLFVSRRPISALACPVIPPLPFRPAFSTSTHSIRAPLLRSSTGYLLQHVPNPRWESAINIVDSKARPLVNPGIRLLRSESLQLTNSYSINPRMIPRTKVDARHFCGLGPIYENKPMIREIPSFRVPVPINRWGHTILFPLSSDHFERHANLSLSTVITVYHI